jgi:hypothetical protein
VRGDLGGEPLDQVVEIQRIGHKWFIERVRLCRGRVARLLPAYSVLLQFPRACRSADFSLL